MKKIINLNNLKLVNLIVLIFIFSCSKDFLDRPLESGYSKDQFYETPDQLAVATNALYIAGWRGWVSDRFWVFSEIASGNAFTFDSRNRDFVTFSFNNRHEALENSWGSLYGVIAQCNSVIIAIETQSGPSISEIQLNNALGEARTIRALAYFHLVRLFGDIPIYDNTELAALNTEIRKNFASDVYRFIKEDLNFAIDNITHTKSSEPGRITANAAKALLAKVSLHTQDYTDAYNLTNQVISSGEFSLMNNYGDLFLTENDNNNESIIALQWTNTGDYNEGNGTQSHFAYSQITGFGDGWSSLAPSIDLIQSFERIGGNVIDRRFNETLMTPGTFYPNLNGGYTVSSDPSSYSRHNTGAGIKKYVIGRPEYNGGGAQQSYPNNTYMLRYADVLLMHAESVLRGGGGSAIDAENVLNMVRSRAGLGPITNPSLNDVFNERRHEFAFEGERWYDLLRMDDRLTKIANTERGFYENNNFNELRSINTVLSEDQLLFPIPLNEIVANPNLNLPPVAYYE